ncbi:MAG: adenylosuccinate synthase [Candidatus Latescibacteria bacterium]|nr:adenylosuccinate synthase [Candidatus Latescibacterota bacterium]
MAVRIVIGAQWGDEAKAKVVDYLAKEADIVVRFGGGANAGHTVVVNGEKFVFHLVPAGIVHPDKVCVIGNGTVIDPAALLSEMEELKSRGISFEGRLFISQNAHLVMPYHKLLDRVEEAVRSEDAEGGGRIGTTGRGIGPCYRDKINRTTGIRIVDLLDREILREKLLQNIREKNQLLTKLYDHDKMDEEKIIEEYLAFDKQIDPFVKDASVYLNDAIDAGKSVLFEGAQGTLLDVDHGTYPYVTSSNTTAGGACTGTGVGPTKIDEVIGVAKAYTTRVGYGPFPTELTDDLGERIRKIAQEFGATTGRSRRCGWFDALVVRFSARVNGLSSLAVTRLDVLDTLDHLQICTAYRYQGKVLQHFPSDVRILEQCEPIYETLEGWKAPTTRIRRLQDLPDNARRYLDRISALAKTPISLISVGPDREETILVDG